MGDPDQPLMPWQRHVVDVASEVDADRQFRRRDVALLVARQNGKTRVLADRIRWALVAGRRVAHFAQVRSLAEDVFRNHVAPDFAAGGRLSGLTVELTKGNGRERLATSTGGVYRVFALDPDAPRGWSCDDLIFDEARHITDWEAVNAARPLITASPNPQVWWASNAGTADSVVLNHYQSLGRSGDPSLAYFEYSAAPNRSPDDRQGWAEANPSVGTTIGWDYLEAEQATMSWQGWETERLCRQVPVLEAAAVNPTAWAECRVATIDQPDVVFAAIDVDAETHEGCLTLAWPIGDGRFAVAAMPDTHPDRIVERVGELRSKGAAIRHIGFDPFTTRDVARQLDAQGLPTQAVTGAEWFNASAMLADLVAQRRVAHVGQERVERELTHAGRRTTVDGRWRIYRHDAPITAVSSMARALWLAARPRPQLVVY